MSLSNNERTDAILSQMVKATEAAEVFALYDKWSGCYEEDLLGMQHSYTHPQKIAKVAAAHLPDKNCRVIDVCAGTGLGGIALQQVGFTNIDAIDGSSGMLEQARSKNVYSNLYQELIGHDKINSFPEGTYDAVVTSGSFVPGHLGARHLRPLLGALRPGGVFCMAMRDAWLEDPSLQDLEPEMLRMEEAGLWQRVSWEKMQHYHDDKVGNVYVYRKA